MTTPVLPGFYDQGVGADPLSMGKGERKRGCVPATSVEAWLRVNTEGRSAEVYWMLEPYTHVIQGQCADDPTTAELAYDHQEHMPDGWDWTRWLLYIRRGMSDLSSRGMVIKTGKRECKCLFTEPGDAYTWRVKSR